MPCGRSFCYNSCMSANGHRCKLCLCDTSTTYIGKTKRHLAIRVKEHKQSQSEYLDTLLKIQFTLDKDQCRSKYISSNKYVKKHTQTVALCNFISIKLSENPS